MKIYPKKSAENSSLLGSWKSPALEYCTHRSKRCQWHKLHKSDQLGEQLDAKYWGQCSRRTTKKAVSRMAESQKIEYISPLPSLEFGDWELD